MPKEYAQLKGAPVNVTCKYCGVPLAEEDDLLMRGCVQSEWRRLLRMRYCAVICRYCKSIVGWERP